MTETPSHGGSEDHAAAGSKNKLASSARPAWIPIVKDGNGAVTDFKLPATKRAQMKYILILFVAAFIACSTPAKDETKNAAENGVNDGGDKTNDVASAKGFSISVPPGWEVQYEYEGTDIMLLSPTDMSDSFRENLNVIVPGDPGNITVDEYADLSVEMLESSATNFELLGKGADKIDGADARWIDYKFDYMNRAIYGRQYMVIKNNKAYVITYSGATKDEDTFKEASMNALKTVKLQ